MEKEGETRWWASGGRESPADTPADGGALADAAQDSDARRDRKSVV